MSISEIINNYLNISESYQLPDKMMKCLFNKENRIELFDNILEFDSDLSKDKLFEYFQEEHGSREKLKQDFTPPEVCRLVAEMSEKPKRVLDVCSGTGGLSIAIWNRFPDLKFHFEEVSGRTIPLLLFNLSIRNMNAVVKHIDVLTREVFDVYKLTPDEKYSNIEKTERFQDEEADLVISNPPYSLKWEQKEDERFKYGLAPNSKADFAFIQHCFYRLKDDGEMYIVAPHGILFRGGAEGKIRQKFLENNNIDIVVGLPEKMFLNTAIPVVVIKFKKQKENNNILFIDSSENFKLKGKRNYLTGDNINSIIAAIKLNKPVERFSNIIGFEEIKENDFNLNIPRYVDISVPEPIPDLLESVKEYVKLELEIKETEKELIKMMKNLVDTTDQEELNESIRLLERL